MAMPKWFLPALLVSGVVALFSASAQASTAKPGEALAFDPQVGAPRKRAKLRSSDLNVPFPVDVYAWGPDGTLATMVVASDDPLSWFAYVPRVGGGVGRVLAAGKGTRTPAMLAAMSLTLAQVPL